MDQVVMRALRQVVQLLPLHRDPVLIGTLTADADGLREVLDNAIASSILSARPNL
jgi:hypothetical protein